MPIVPELMNPALTWEYRNSSRERGPESKGEAAVDKMESPGTG
ncbi:MAG: hypothetical protein ACU826_12820 [Gammaproteobacteria bacterium]